MGTKPAKVCALPKKFLHSAARRPVVSTAGGRTQASNIPNAHQVGKNDRAGAKKFRLRKIYIPELTALVRLGLALSRVRQDPACRKPTRGDAAMTEPNGGKPPAFASLGDGHHLLALWNSSDTNCAESALGGGSSQ